MWKFLLISTPRKGLFITQPTLTVFLNTLERNLGFKLFDRTKNPIALTKSGKLYMEQMRKLLYEEDKLVEKVNNNVVLTEITIKILKVLGIIFVIGFMMIEVITYV